MQGGDTHDYLAENVTCECGFARVTFRNLVANHTSHGANMKAVGQGVGTISDIVFDILRIIDLPLGGGALVIDAHGQWSARSGISSPAPAVKLERSAYSPVGRGWEILDGRQGCDFV
eukprot:COSAG06_NODE_3620_length_5108_cov_1.692753_1_plen_117_part_00